MEAGHQRVLVLAEGGAARSLEDTLRAAGYEDLHVTDAFSSAAALAADLRPHLVLVDLNGPDFPGLDAIRELLPGASAAGVSVAVASAPSDTVARTSALALGARDFVTKPVDEEEVRVRVGNLLDTQSLYKGAEEQAEITQDEIRRRNTELWDSLMHLEEARKNLQTAQEETLSRLSMAAELKDDETSGHVERMSRYCALLAEATGADSGAAETLRLASRLHDIGKIGVSDVILLKDGILTPTERRKMEQHVPIGVKLLRSSHSHALQVAAVVAGSHHERFDGTGYPDGLVGEDIPLEGRIAAIADVFDALTHTRPYRRAFPLGHVLDMLRKESGKHFDPALLEAFLDSMNTVLEIYEEHRESA